MTPEENIADLQPWCSELREFILPPVSVNRFIFLSEPNFHSVIKHKNLLRCLKSVYLPFGCLIPVIVIYNNNKTLVCSNWVNDWIRLGLKINWKYSVLSIIPMRLKPRQSQSEAATIQSETECILICFLSFFEETVKHCSSAALHFKFYNILLFFTIYVKWTGCIFSQLAVE